jgi:hypothetical protein
MENPKFTIRERKTPTPEYPYEVYNGPRSFSMPVSSIWGGEEYIRARFPGAQICIHTGAPITLDEAIAIAQKYYNKGGSGIVECWDEKSWEYLNEEIPMTKGALMEMIRLYQQDEAGYAV